MQLRFDLFNEALIGEEAGKRRALKVNVGGKVLGLRETDFGELKSKSLNTMSVITYGYRAKMSGVRGKDMNLTNI